MYFWCLFFVNMYEYMVYFFIYIFFALGHDLTNYKNGVAMVKRLRTTDLQESEVTTAARHFTFFLYHFNNNHLGPNDSGFPKIHFKIVLHLHPSVLVA
jgi:hypothetical protein